MILAAFTLLHVFISLVGIFTGFAVLFRFCTGQSLSRWTPAFLSTTVATSITGFLFPAEHFMPSHAVGILSLLVLALTCYALYARRLAGGWRKVYVITAVTALYFNTFVGVVQSFRRFPFLKELAPTQTETPFKIAQLAVPLLFIAAGFIAVAKFRDQPETRA